MYGINILCSYRVVRLCSLRYYSSRSTKKLLEFLATMPKQNTARITDTQRQRINIANKSEKYSPSTIYLQVIGSGAKGSPNTLYLFTDQKRYLFNCGECTQRLAHEHKIKLSKLEHIFITSKSWRNIGGLPGLSLTLQDVGIPNITLHGPEGLDELYNATKRFVIMKEMNVTMAKCSATEDFEDNTMSVKYVILGPHASLFDPDMSKPAAKKPKIENPVDKQFEEFVNDETDYYKSCVNNDLKHKPVKDKPKPKPSLDRVEAVKKKTEKVLQELQRKTNCTVAFICKLKNRMGTLDLAKCVERGVKPGPLLGQLKNGQDVVLPNGDLVLSKDVKTPDDPGPVFIVMEVPELTYLKDTEFAPHFDNGDNPPENIPALIVHYTPPHVFNHPTYRAFMQQFGPSTRHMVLNTQNSCLGSEAVHRTQHKLHLLDSDIFPLLKDASIPAVWNSHPPPSNDSPASRGIEELKNKIALAQFQNIINIEGSKGDGQVCKEDGEGPKLEILAGKTLTMFHLRPKRKLDRSAEPKLHIQDYIQEAMDEDGFVTSLEQFRRLVENVRFNNSDLQREYPKVVFLGTGSCIPSKTRNTSAIVLQIDENRSMLLDCGEGTFGQLVRFYGPKKVNVFLRTLKAIYISHLHADHHIGLIGVIQARREAFEQVDIQPEPLYLLAPGQIYSWLHLYDLQFERIQPDFQLLPNQTLLLGDEKELGAELPAAIVSDIGVQSVRTCQVMHCPNAFGVCVDLDGSHRVTYSGDTLPCDALVNLGQNCTLLIHEATMEDELSEEARVKMHSTTTQAIDVGRQMNARFTVLTHFSQRYARLPRLNANILNDNKTVGIAFDNMQITLNDLELLPHMYAPLQLMFAEHCIEMELKAAHRAKQKERRNSRSISPSVTHSVKSNPTQSYPNRQSVSVQMQNNGTRGRNLSPSCKPAVSTPTYGRYRESIASRLRQEMKGMALAGIVREPHCKSISPIRQSENSSPPRVYTSDCVVSATHDSEKAIDINSSPHISDTSSLNKNTGKRLRTTPSAPTGHATKLRSKVLGNGSDTEKESVIPIKKGKALTSHFNDADVRISKTSGYGRPLVTPIHKKLSIRRDFHLSPPPPPKETRARSAKSRLEDRPPFATSSNHAEILRPKSIQNSRVNTLSNILVRMIMWRAAHIASYFVMKAWISVIAFIALGILFWTATKRVVSANSSKTHNSVSCVPRRDDKSHSAQSRAPASATRPKSSCAHGETKTLKKQTLPSDLKTPDPKSSLRHRSKAMKTDTVSAQETTDTPLRSPCSKIPRKISPEANATSNTSLGKSSTEKLKQQFCRDTPVYAAGKHNAMIHSNKSFKPQLEDIKSSYLILNDQERQKAEQRDKPIVETDESTSECPPVTKLDRFEEQRREQLNKIKLKFKSRRFFDDSRFEKIEGLNWISWK